MPNVFGALEMRLGAATTAAFSNAVMVLPDGEPVPGILTQAPAQSIGSVGMQARDVSFVCRTAAANTVLVKGSTGTINGTAWKVAARLDLFETGDTELDLERP